MDLDKLKSKWESLDKKAQESSIRDEKIRILLKNRGKGIINRLKIWAMLEFAFTVVLIITAPIILLSVELSQVYKLIMYALLGFMICALPWEYLKNRTLRRIDIVNQNLLEVSKSMAFFRKLISYDIIFGILFVIGLDTVLFRVLTASTQSIILCIIIQSIIIAALYRLMYLNGIKKMREVLEEIEIFENS